MNSSKEKYSGFNAHDPEKQRGELRRFCLCQDLDMGCEWDESAVDSINIWRQVRNEHIQSSTEQM